jgi:GrpB-like predicted nucleotidyltransferase (UPF0157 family)
VYAVLLLVAEVRLRVAVLDVDRVRRAVDRVHDLVAAASVWQGPYWSDVTVGTMARQSLDPADPPPWAFESVHLSPYDPQWPDQASAYADQLRPVLSQWLLGPIEHVGSTAIPGLIAKPVIDLMAQTADPDLVVAQTQAALREMNWQYVPPELDGRPFRRFLAKVSPDDRHRLAHLHLMSGGADRWDQQIRFRDALRADPRLRDEYAAVKSRLANSFGDVRERYTDEKAVFVKAVLRDLDAAGAS